LTHLFVRSMFSTRTLVAERSTEACSDAATAPFRVTQVVVLLVDALTPTVAVGPARASDRPHTATFTYLRERLFGEAPAQAAPYADCTGFVSVADAPTTTSQRLKAIMTGSIPAFIEAGANFNSDAVEEDNLVAQLAGRATVLGDDTWLRLFPSGITPWRAAHVYPSFDVRDLDTVDAGVLSHLDAEIQAGAEAPLVIGHFLGVDHAGHSFNARHELLYAKVRQLNSVVRNVTQRLRQVHEIEPGRRTLLVVLGDHGMTESGDHGGGTPEETDTFLYAELFNSRRDGSATDAHQPISHPELLARLEEASRLSREHSERRRESATDLQRVYESYDFVTQTQARATTRRSVGPVNGIGAIHQIDMLPTLAVMLGVPIPRSNVGRVIPEVLMLAGQYTPVGKRSDATAPPVTLEDALAEVMQCNEAQMVKMAARDVRDFRIPSATSHSAMATQRIASHWEAMGDVARQTRAAFGTMDDDGLWGAAMALAVVSALWALSLAVDGSVPMIISPARIGFAGVAVMVLCVIYGPSAVTAPAPAALAIGITCACITKATVVLRCVWQVLRTAPMAVAVALFVIRVIAPFSNSFIVDEETIVLFLFASAFVLTALVEADGDFTAPRLARPLGFLVAVRTVYELGHRDRSFEEVPIQPTSVFRRFLDLLTTTPMLVDGNPIAAVCWKAFRVLVYESIAVHVLPAVAIMVALLSRYAASGGASRLCTPRFVGVVMLAWLLCLAKAETALPRVAHAVFLVAFVPRTAKGTASTQSTDLLRAVTLHCAAWLFFFASGFQTTFSTIDWHAAFVGVPEYSFVAGAMLVFVHTGAPAFMTHFAARGFLDSDSRSRLQTQLAALQWIHLTCATLSLAKHRRHLMVWEIFMPHYVFVLGYAVANVAAYIVTRSIWATFGWR
jgi:hypothetical protein